MGILRYNADRKMPALASCFWFTLQLPVAHSCVSLQYKSGCASLLVFRKKKCCIYNNIYKMINISIYSNRKSKNEELNLKIPVFRIF